MTYVGALAAITAMAVWQLHKRLPWQNIAGASLVVIGLATTIGWMSGRFQAEPLLVPISWDLIWLSSFFCSWEFGRRLFFSRLGTQHYALGHFLLTAGLFSTIVSGPISAAPGLGDWFMGSALPTVMCRSFAVYAAVAILFLATASWMIDKREPIRSGGVFPILWFVLAMTVAVGG